MPLGLVSAFLEAGLAFAPSRAFDELSRRFRRAPNTTRHFLGACVRADGCDRAIRRRRDPRLLRASLEETLK